METLEGRWTVRTFTQVNIIESQQGFFFIWTLLLDLHNKSNISKTLWKPELSGVLCVRPSRCSRGGWTARWTSTGPGINTRRALGALLESTGSVRDGTKLTIMCPHDTLLICVHVGFRSWESLPPDSEEEVRAAGRHGGLWGKQGVRSLLLILCRSGVHWIHTACIWIHWWRGRWVSKTNQFIYVALNHQKSYLMTLFLWSRSSRDSWIYRLNNPPRVGTSDPDLMAREGGDMI